MRRAVAASVLGAALSVILAGGSDARLTDPELRWCRADSMRSVAEMRERLGIVATPAPGVLATPRRTAAAPKSEPPRPAKPQRAFEPAHRSETPRLLVRFEGPPRLAPGLQNVASSCVGSHAGILCPGFQLVGMNY